MTWQRLDELDEGLVTVKGLVTDNRINDMNRTCAAGSPLQASNDLRWSSLLLLLLLLRADSSVLRIPVVVDTLNSLSLQLFVNVVFVVTSSSTS